MIKHKKNIFGMFFFEEENKINYWKTCFFIFLKKICILKKKWNLPSEMSPEQTNTQKGKRVWQVIRKSGRWMHHQKSGQAKLSFFTFLLNSLSLLHYFIFFFSVHFTIISKTEHVWMMRLIQSIHYRWKKVLI